MRSGGDEDARVRALGRAPNVERTFRVPWVPVVPIAGICINLYLMLSLSAFTWMAFGIWIAIGLVVYFAFSRRSFATPVRSIIFCPEDSEARAGSVNS